MFSSSVLHTYFPVPSSKHKKTMAESSTITSVTMVVFGPGCQVTRVVLYEIHDSCSQHQSPEPTSTSVSPKVERPANLTGLDAKMWGIFSKQ